MSASYHPLVKRVLDGELSLAELPPELHAAGAEALRLLEATDRSRVELSHGFEQRVMTAVRAHAASPVRRAWRWLAAPRLVEVRLRVRPWAAWSGALAAAAVLVVLLTHPAPSVPRSVAIRDSVFVRFVLYAPGAQRVAVAGTFNQWDLNAAPLVPAGTSGVWTTTLALPVGEHQYAFVVDGARWVADPAAPGVDDGFGRRNSVMAVTPRGARVL